MILRYLVGIPFLFAFLAFISLSSTTFAETVTGTVEPTTALGQYLKMTVTIDDANTIFELTGPSFSWFSFGFDTTTMEGYSIIVEGTGNQRTAFEQNLLDIGVPGSPQATQDLQLMGVSFDSVKKLSTITLKRASSTGNEDDPDFSPEMTELNLIWAYSAFSSAANPVPTLGYHGFNGHGTTLITFAAVPEPASLVTVISGLATAFAFGRRRR